MLKRIYYLLFAPKEKKMVLKFKEIISSFYVNNYESLLIVENALKKGVRDESDFLEVLFSELKSGDVVYDIGANMGIYTIFLAKKLGKEGVVIAFEPEKENSLILKKNIKINKLNNVKVFTKALADQNGQKYLYKNIKGGISGYTLVQGSDRKPWGKIDIYKGDDLVNVKKLPIPNAVKIDVEGFEFPVLKGLEQTLSSERCKILCCEIHNCLYPKSITSRDVLTYINKLGFTKIETSKRGSELHAICYR